MQTALARERLVWILVFSIPPGVGVAGFVSMTFSGGSVSPLSVGVGAATTVVLAGFLALVTVSGSDEPPEQRREEAGR